MPLATRASTLVALLWICCCLCGVESRAAKKRPLELRRVQLTLPGLPAKVIPTDLDGDGRQDLLFILAYTEIETIGVARVEDLVQFTTVIPAVFDRREAQAYLARTDGGYERVGQPLALENVLAVAAGPEGMPPLALTDDGVAEIVLDLQAETVLTLRPLIEEPPVIAGSRSFFSSLDWVLDLDGDGDKDVWIPALDGPALYLNQDGRIATSPVQRLSLPGDRRGTAMRHYPLPAVQDLNGDQRPDLLVRSRYDEHNEMHVLLGQPDGRFAPIYAGDAACTLGESALRFVGPEGEVSTTVEDLVFFGDLDGNGRAELVTQTKIDPEKTGMRASMKDAKRPRHTFRFYRLDERLRVEEQPYQEIETEGYSFEATFGGVEFSQFIDLDADGRTDLITITLDFSMFGMLKAMATKRMTIGLNFHVWAQHEDGSFREVEGLDLTEKLRLDMKRFKIGRLAQFQGDYDGDGRIDFVRFGHGKRITIHLGQPGCRYRAEPDLLLELEEEPQDLELIRVADYDGDGRSDFSIMRLLPATSVDVSPPVRIDFYLSGTP